MTEKKNKKKSRTYKEKTFYNKYGGQVSYRREIIMKEILKT